MVLEPCRNSDPTDIGQESPSSSRHYLHRVLPLLFSGINLTRLSCLGSSGSALALPLENLREANLIHCEFPPTHLGGLLRRCTQLRKFVYTADNTIRPGRRPDHSTRVTPREAIEALEPAYGSLEVLGMDLGGLWPAPGWLSIPSLRQFTALKVLYITLNCVWDRRAMRNTDAPPNPDMLFTTLLPDSIEEVALFDTGSTAQGLGFMVEAHVERLGLDVKEKGRFQQLKRLRGKGFWPCGYDLDPGALVNSVHLGRIIALNDAKAVLEDSGVEVIFDIKGNLDLEFGNMVSLY